MSDAATPSTPPGWYPDASGTTRWWSGVEWTEHTAAAANAAAPGIPRRPMLPADRPIYPVWIWLIVFLPLVTYGLFFTWQPSFDYSALSSPDTYAENPFSVYTGLFTPAYFLIIASSLVIYGLSVFFAYRDLVWLRRQGVERPFAWQLAFIPSWGALIYTIGRSVVVRQVARPRGLTPLWVTIAVYVVGFGISIVWTVMLTTEMMQQVTQFIPTS